MDIRRFYAEPKDVRDNRIIISGREFNHITRVMRYKKGFKLIVSTGDGWDYDCEITSINEENLICHIENKRKNDCMPRIKVQLFSALIKEDNYEFIVKKGTELGISSIVPVITEYTNEKKIRLDRLRLIAVEASKQCGRAAPTEISEPVSLDDALNIMLSFDMPLAAYESERAVYLKDILQGKTPETISLLIGPEGGFSDIERELIKSKGIPTFSLGKRILKAETAAIAAVANIMYELDR